MTTEYPTATFVGTVCHAVIEAYDFNPLISYCVLTGKPIGDSYEIQDLILTTKGSVDEVRDELAMRCLASMRPSIFWNRIRTETIGEMRKLRPVETLSFLLNRLLEPTPSQRHGDFAKLHQNRIHLWQALSGIDPARPEFGQVMVMLLEIESKQHLRLEESPIEYAKLLKAEDILKTLESLFSPWHAKRKEFFEQAEYEAKFFAKNPGARKAFFEQMRETGPKSEATVKREKKQQSSNVMDSILDAIMHPESVPTKTAAQRVDMDSIPASKPMASTKMPKWGQTKKAEG